MVKRNRKLWVLSVVGWDYQGSEVNSIRTSFKWGFRTPTEELFVAQEEWGNGNTHISISYV